MGPLAFLAGIDGELYYDAVTAWDDGDPWEGVYRFGGNGDGTLLYPGTPEHLGRAAPAPVPSLRLKTIRDGLEDYEMLALLARTGDGPFAQRAVRRLVQSGWEITASVETWAAVHRALGERASAGWVRAAGAR